MKEKEGNQKHVRTYTVHLGFPGTIFQVYPRRLDDSLFSLTLPPVFWLLQV